MDIRRDERPPERSRDRRARMVLPHNRRRRKQQDLEGGKEGQDEEKRGKRGATTPGQEQTATKGEGTRQERGRSIKLWT